MLKSLIISLALFYLILAIYAVLVSDFLIFRPHASSYTDEVPLFKLKTESGIPFSALYLEVKSAPLTLLFSHGNAEDLGDFVDFLTEWQKRGFSVLAYDYPGYGTSEGRPTTKNAKEAAKAAYIYLVEQGIRPEQIVVYGRSLGGSLASYTAARYPVGGIILESAFLSAFRVLTYYPILPFDKLIAANDLAHIEVPMLFIHGTKDRTIPFFHGRKLFEAAISPKKQHFWVEGAGHNDLLQVAGESYFDTVEKFLKTIGQKNSIHPTS